MRRRIAYVAVLGAAVVAASSIGRAQTPSAAPTFSKDVAPILYKNCVSCHRAGEMAPMSLLSYDDARPYARAIQTKVAEGSMPPWHAEAPRGTFLNDRRLSDAEKDVIVRWASAGAPRGDVKDLPPAPKFPEGWTIGTPDAVITMPKPFEVPAAGTIPYKYIEVPTNFTEDKWVQSIEIRPGAPSVVHHVLAYSREPEPTPRPGAFVARNDRNAPPRPAPTAAAAANRSATPNRGVLIATTAPGTNAIVYQPGTATLVKAGSVITFQIHYTANGTATGDQTSVGMVFAKQPPVQEIRTSAFLNALFTIPAGASEHQVDSGIDFTEDAHIVALFPHTHLRGRSWEYRLIQPDGRSEVVLSVPKYDFNWQTYYEFAEPLRVPKGARLEATARYDNSTSNKSNPDPKVDVKWGEQTWQEMQYSGISYTIDSQRRTGTSQQ